MDRPGPIDLQHLPLWQVRTVGRGGDGRFQFSEGGSLEAAATVTSYQRRIVVSDFGAFISIVLSTISILSQSPVRSEIVHC